MKKQLKATLLAAASASMLAVGMTACNKKTTEPVPPAKEPTVEATKTETAAPAKTEAPASSKPKDHPAH